MTNRFFTCGVRLHPGTLSLLAGVPASEFADRVFSIEEIFGAQGRSLRYRLDGIRNAEEAVTILAEFSPAELRKQISALETLLCLQIFKPRQKKVEPTEDEQFLIKVVRKAMALHDRKEQETPNERAGRATKDGSGSCESRALRERFPVPQPSRQGRS